MSSPSNEPRWLTKAILLALHDESIARFGGVSGVRDDGLLESALARPRNLHAYHHETPIPQLAAAYGYGLARNHPFVDGNKRAALLAMAVFLAVNGLVFEPDQLDEVRTITALAAGNLSEEGLVQWVTGTIALSSPP